MKSKKHNGLLLVLLGMIFTALFSVSGPMVVEASSLPITPLPEDTEYYLYSSDKTTMETIPQAIRMPLSTELRHTEYTSRKAMTPLCHIK